MFVNQLNADNDKKELKNVSTLAQQPTCLHLKDSKNYFARLTSIRQPSGSVTKKQEGVPFESPLKSPVL